MHFLNMCLLRGGRRCRTGRAWLRCRTQGSAAKDTQDFAAASASIVLGGFLRAAQFEVVVLARTGLDERATQKGRWPSVGVCVVRGMVF